MTIPPVHREILVAATADRAFALFTGRIGDWWPLGDYAVYDDGTIWAEVTEWHPPRVLRLSWHPGSTVERAADLRMRAH